MLFLLFFYLCSSATLADCNFVSLSIRPIDYVLFPENLELTHCSFNNITSLTENGGALRYTSSVNNFSNYFTCCSYCCALNGFGMTFASDTMGHHEAYASSIQYSSYQNNIGRVAGMYFIKGYQSVTNTNSSNNVIVSYSGIGFESAQSLLYTHSSVSNGKAQNWAALCYRLSGYYKSEYINCINNSQFSTSWGIISNDRGNSVMTKCVILNNGKIGEKILFCSTGSLTITDSSVQSGCINNGATIVNSNTLTIPIPLVHFKSQICGYDFSYTHETKHRCFHIMMLNCLILI